jgi:hypothetical protein
MFQVKLTLNVASNEINKLKKQNGPTLFDVDLFCLGIVRFACSIVFLLVAK